MNKCAINDAASPVCFSGGYAKCGQLNKKGWHGQEPREHSAVSSDVIQCSHQRRWSADFCKCGTSAVITVRKNKKEPQPPQRGVSLLRPQAASHYSSNRYSCPPIGVLISPARSSSSSSSSSSSTSSCSSPPPVQTSAITGHDPRGWRLHPRSSSTSLQARTNRLSLQIPLTVIFPDPGSVNNPAPPLKTKPPLQPKPSRRRHSDSSAFLRSPATPLPKVMLEELRAVHLRPLVLRDKSDDVFSRGNKEREEVPPRPRKTPPPVPEKTSTTRQAAQLMVHSHQSCRPLTANEDISYSSVINPKPNNSHPTEDRSRMNARITGLYLDNSCDRERSTPRFPG